MSKLWEVDPETRSKLQDIQKENENNKCVDCGAPSPQWASPKFGIFFCLSCSGQHRHLGVHISFVRSITMDSFKTAELLRMKNGGNKPWRDFFFAHESNKGETRTFKDISFEEKYDSEAGDEWKERLTAKVEGKEYVPSPPVKRNRNKTGTNTPTGMGASGSRSQTPLSKGRPSEIGNSTPGRSNSPAIGTASLGRKAQNEAYFAKMGNENASRSEHVPPSQGGKYGGFGSDPFPEEKNDGGVPGVDDFQKDPMAALTKGFGWLSSTVTKTAATGYEGWVKPGMQKLAEADIAAQARNTAMNIGTNANTAFSRFVEGGDAQQARGGNAKPERADFWESFGEAPKPSGKEKDFWDEFSNASTGPAGAGGLASMGATSKKSSSVGTAAMKKPAGANGGGGTKKDDDDWGKW